MAQPIRVKDVFIAGQFPTLTYNPRTTKELESKFREYLDDDGKCLVVSGPSKSGKTVLVERLLPEERAVWVNGAHIATTNDLWESIIDQLDLFTEVERLESSGESVQAGVGVEAGLGGFFKVSADARPTIDSSASSSGRRVVPGANAVKAALDSKPVPIVIDDFHYIDESIRLDIARTVKDLIRRTHVVLIAVPHEAFDAVRREREMDFRVWNLEVSPWDESELLEIAHQGFSILNVVDYSDAVGKHLALSSLGAPFLMQQLCRDFLIGAGIRERPDVAVELTPPTDWAIFLGEIADRYEPGVFRTLLKGPPTRGTERVVRSFRDGRSTDIYGAVAYAVSKMETTQNLSYRAIAQKLSDVLTEAPRTENITNALTNMAAIARDNRQGGDPALDYKDGELHILDPFFAFHLRHGNWSLPAAPGADF